MLLDAEGNDEESVAEEDAGNWRQKDVDDEAECVIDEFGCMSLAPNGLRLVGLQNFGPNGPEGRAISPAAKSNS